MDGITSNNYGEILAILLLIIRQWAIEQVNPLKIDKYKGKAVAFRKKKKTLSTCVSELTLMFVAFRCSFRNFVYSLLCH